MMRWLMALLLILNLLTLAWQWDAFARWGWGPNTAREPERVLNQLRPEAIQVETPAAASQRMAASAASEASAAASTGPAASASVPSAPVTPAPASPAAKTNP
ncbi:hypothetical protein [Limnohabitans sp. T6-20]|uniref:hypothetical protein n=1 Tax=Limnohabitans sp. T6-20 TaxID=1100725 RepID=UPI000D3C3DFF|nr:hypothetical protein [Limnohabitans sp. T6-20]PUE12517.1 hypothetical protein B9Z33_03050 [Limnohabitans sp. T6-20]